MIFRSFLRRVTLRRAVLTATAVHQSSAVRDLLSCHGHLAFASALSSCSPDVVARTLSLLPQEDSSTVIANLPVKAWERFMDACEPGRVRDRERHGLQALIVWSVHA